MAIPGYSILGRIGEGQFGSVDVARSTAGGRLFAVKTISKSSIARAGQAVDVSLERDIHALAADTGAHYIPHLHASFQSQDVVSLLTAYIPCGSLWDLFISSSTVDFLLANTRNAHSCHLEERIVMHYASQVVLGLAWLHEVAEVVHRDIKPQNCLIDVGGRIKICDFGSAARLLTSTLGEERPRSLAEKRDRRRSISPEVIPATSNLWWDVWLQPRRVSSKDCAMMHGTPDYIAPEIITSYEASLIPAQPVSPPKNRLTGEREGDQFLGYDASVDWWSFGVMVYELAIGKPAFWAKTVRATHDKVLSCETSLAFPSHPSMSPDFRDLIKSLLSLPENRLGRLGPSQIRSHPWFSDTDWAALSCSPALPPPVWLKPPEPVDLDELEDTLEVSLGIGGWDQEGERREWGGSSGDESGGLWDQSCTARMEWADWPWIGDINPERTLLDRTSTSSIQTGHPGRNFPLATPAPKQPSSPSQFRGTNRTVQPPRTVLRSVVRQKVQNQSSRKAMRELKEYVMRSARKKVDVDMVRQVSRGGLEVQAEDLDRKRSFLDRLNHLALGNEGPSTDTQHVWALNGEDRPRQVEREWLSAGSVSTDHASLIPAPRADGRSSPRTSTPDLVFSGRSDATTEIATITSREDEDGSGRLRNDGRMASNGASVNRSALSSGSDVIGRGDLDTVKDAVERLHRQIEVIDRAIASVRTRLDQAVAKEGTRT